MINLKVIRPKVIIQYPFIPLYRVPIFKRLAGSNNYNYEFWVGEGSSDEYLKTIFLESGLSIEKTPLKILKLPFLKHPLELQFSSIIKLIKNPPDVFIILGNPYAPSTWILIIIARLRGCKVLSWSHGFLTNEKGLKGFFRILFYKLPQGHLLYGNKAKEIMIDKGFDPEEIDVIYNSLDYEKQAALRDSLTLEDRHKVRGELNISKDATVLIAIGRLLRKLKLEQAIDGVRRLNDKGTDIYFIIVGDGPEKSNLMKNATSLNILNKIIFYGACHEEEKLSKLFNASDICVVMGKVGLSAMHSLGYGVPLITNDNLDKHFPEIEVIKEGITGWFFKEDKVEDFISKVKPIPYRGKYYLNCIKAIEDRYTPEKQFEFIETALDKYTKS